MSAVNTPVYDFDLEALINVAMNQLKFSYVPYSNYPVGCALLCPDGKIIGGSNIENAAYGPGICAERSAIATACSQGYRTFKAVVVSCKALSGSPCCGACRQVLREFCPQDCPIININGNREIIHRHTMASLLPDSFGPENLNIFFPGRFNF